MNEYTRMVQEASYEELVSEFNLILQKKSAFPRSVRDLVCLRVKHLMDTNQIKVETERPVE